MDNYILKDGITFFRNKMCKKSPYKHNRIYSGHGRQTSYMTLPADEPWERGWFSQK